MPQDLLNKVLAARGKIEGERRQVTVLLADMQGYTSLSERLGEERVFRLMEPLYKLMIKAVHRHEGMVQKLTGDGILALFGAPVALEDGPLRACRASLEIQSRMRDIGAEIEAEYGVRPELRIGINTGPVVVGTVGTDLRMEFEVVGDTVNLASRLEGLANPGEILVGEATHRPVANHVQSSFVGERTVKGKTAPQRVYRLDGLRSRAASFDASLSRGLTRLVGRERELETLEGLWGESKQGAVRMVNVVGDAGMGKSRVLYELRGRLEGERALFLQGHCTADGASTPFLSFIDVIRASFGLGEEDSQSETTEKLRRGVERVGLKGDLTVPLLQNLLGLAVDGDALDGLNSQNVGRRTQLVLQDLLRERCRLSPVVLAIEDLHWIDSASESLLMQVSGLDEPLPLLIICTFRPQYQPRWGDESNATTLQLEPLPRETTVQLLRHRLGVEDAPEELVDFVSEKAAGNPLFAEEMLQYLQDRGAFDIAGERAVLRGELSTGPMPGTLQNIIMARVDRLPERQRTLLQACAVIGRRFSAGLLRPVGRVNGTLPGHLKDLEAQQLIFRPSGEREDEYEFKHAVIQEAIYEGLLQRQREDLHERVAKTIEQAYEAQLGEWVEVLAHHYRLTPRAEKAVYYMARAADKCLRLYSLEEADLRFRQTVELIEAVPGCADDAFLAEVLLGWARLHLLRMDFMGLIALLEPYVDRVEATGDKRRLSLILSWLGLARSSAARLDTAARLLERAQALGKELGDEECIAFAYIGRVWVYYWAVPSDQPADIIDQLGDRVLSFAERSGDLFLANLCLLALSVTKTRYDRFDEARAIALRLVELGRTAGDPSAVASGLAAMAWSDFSTEHYAEAIENADEALRIAPDPLSRFMALGAKGATLAFMGQAQQGLMLLRDVRREAVAADFLFILFGIDIPYGTVMVLAGKMSAGVRWIEESMERYAELGGANQLAFCHAILGEIYLEIAIGEERPTLRMILSNLGFLLRTLPFARRKARHHLEKAIESFRDGGVPHWLTRSLLNLALLCQAQKRWDEAQTQLEEAERIAATLDSAPLNERLRLALEKQRR